MTTVQNTTTIAGPLLAVFDLVTSARFWPEWHAASRAVSGVTQRPYALGDVIHERGEVAGIRFEVTWKVVEHIRPSRVVLRAESPSVRIIYTFSGPDGATSCGGNWNTMKRLLAARPLTRVRCAGCSMRNRKRLSDG